MNRMGCHIEVQLEKPGFYPAGGGRFMTQIQPCSNLKPLHLTERGEIRHRLARATISGLPRDIAKRELKVLQQKMNWPEDCLQIQDLGNREPGNLVTIHLEAEFGTEVFTGFGVRGVSAEAVAEKAASEALRYLEANVPIGEHLADQLLLPLALAGEGSFRTLPLSHHAQTNIEIIRRFLDVHIAIDPSETAHLVRIGM